MLCADGVGWGQFLHGSADGGLGREKKDAVNGYIINKGVSMKVRLISVISIVLVACAMTCISAPDAGILKLKSGVCSFHILDVNGVKPLSDAKVAALSTVDGKSVVSAVSDKLGKCALKLDEGRYLLSIKDQTVSVIEASADAELAQCRVVMPAKPLQVGGAAAAAVPLVAGGAAAPVVGGTVLGVSLTTAAIVGGGVVAGTLVVINQTKNSVSSSQ